MNRQTAEDPPDSTDLEGWRQAVADGCFFAFRLEAIVAAVQDLGPRADRRVLNPLVLHGSDTIQRRLRRVIGRNHKNEGVDMIDRAHEHLIKAMLDPKSADGKGLRVAFFARVDNRAIDAIRAEEKKNKRELAEEAAEGPENQEVQEFDPWDTVNEFMDVERVLACVTDERKRLAFRLHMERIPLRSTRGASIAKALGVSPETVADWIEEVRTLLKTKMGDKT